VRTEFKARTQRHQTHTLHYIPGSGGNECFFLNADCSSLMM